MADTQLNISYHSITDKGGRAVNEDSLGILPTKDALYFLLCGGLGAWKRRYRFFVCRRADESKSGKRDFCRGKHYADTAGVA